MTNQHIVSIMTVWMILTSGLSLMNGVWQFYLFHTSYLINSASALILVTRYVSYKTSIPGAKRLWWFGKRFYVLGVVLWMVDMHLCPHLQAAWPSNPQLHAWWHVLAAIGSYFCCMLTVMCCLESQYTSLTSQGEEVDANGGVSPINHTQRRLPSRDGTYRRPAILYKWGIPYVGFESDKVCFISCVWFVISRFVVAELSRAPGKSNSPSLSLPLPRLLPAKKEKNSKMACLTL